MLYISRCTENCAKGKNYCPKSTCVCSGSLVAPMNNQPTPQRIKTTTTTKRTTTTKPTSTKATYTTRAPTTTSTPTTTVRTFSTPTQAPVVLVSSASYKRCSSNGVLAGDYWNGWCQKQCDKNDCQQEYCNCY